MNSFGEIDFSVIIFINNTQVTFDKVLDWSKFVSELACLYKDEKVGMPLLVLAWKRKAFVLLICFSDWESCFPLIKITAIQNNQLTAHLSVVRKQGKCHLR